MVSTGPLNTFYSTFIHFCLYILPLSYTETGECAEAGSYLAWLQSIQLHKSK